MPRYSNVWNSAKRESLDPTIVPVSCGALQYGTMDRVQGMGRHSLEEVTAKLAQDLDACEALLQQSAAYLSGTSPTQADCMLWAILDMVRMTRLRCA